MMMHVEGGLDDLAIVFGQLSKCKMASEVGSAVSFSLRVFDSTYILARLRRISARGNNVDDGWTDVIRHDILDWI